ncbi:MAG: M23 family metallopeptidase [Chloroflexi bacterium]|nr:M23 family metallopeptidase [Chloroflexota bacterium]
MTARRETLAQIVLAVGAGLVLGCIFGAVAIAGLFVQSGTLAAMLATATPTPTATLPRPQPTITLRPTSTRVPTPEPATPAPTPSPDNTPAPTVARTPITIRSGRIVTNTHLYVTRPVAPNAMATVPALTYLYGTTSRGDYDVHHGEEFVNPTGTPLFAVADGAVVVAGDDTSARLCGDDNKKTCGRDINFYGKLVVIQLARQYKDQRVFALYGHMNRIAVNVGDQVKQGDPLGEIGMTGIAVGPHVHFEIRVGVNDYAHTRNPILWTTPLTGRGALVGRFAEKGVLTRGAIIQLWRADPEQFIYSIESYSRDEFPPVNSDDELGENFAFPDLAAGDYVVRVSGQQYAARVTVEAGKLTFVELGQ